MKRLSLIFFILLPVIANAQESEIWDFPIKPGTEEWRAIEGGYRGCVDACQIPQDVLMALSTENLAKVCLHYPLYMFYMTYNNERKGIEIIIDGFNGLKELSEKEDGALALIKLYDDFPVINKMQYAETRAASPFKLVFLELLLSNDHFISQLDAQGLDLLKKAVLKKYEAKLENSEIYSLYNVRKTLLLGAIISERDDRITKSSEQRAVIKRYIEQYRHVEPSVLTEISKIVSDL